MAGHLIVVGHVSVDEVSNRHGGRTQPGGAALYAAVAARTLGVDVTLVSAVGRDYPFPDALAAIGDAHVRRLRMPSTRFRIRYDDRWEASYPRVVPGAGARIRAADIPGHHLGGDAIVHLAPMRAAKVARIVAATTARAAAPRIAVNTWMGYVTESRRSRELLATVAAAVDFFILNEAEVKALTGTATLSAALARVPAKRCIVTLGAVGALVGGSALDVQLMPALHVPVGRVVDTTGAGDVWCGAFLAAYLRTGNLAQSLSIAAVLASIKCTGWGYERLATLRFRRPVDVFEYAIGLRDGGVQTRLPDFA